MADKIWYVSVGNQRKEGLFSEDDIKGMIQRGEVSPRDLVWKEGMDAWKPVIEVEPFVETAKSVPAPPPTPPVGPNPALEYLKAFGNDLLAIAKDPDTGTTAAANRKPLVSALVWIVLSILMSGLLDMQGNSFNRGGAFGRGLLDELIKYGVIYGFTILALVAIFRSKADWMDVFSIIGLAAIPTVVIGLVAFLLLWAHPIFHCLIVAGQVLTFLLFAHLFQHTSQLSKRLTLYCVPAIYLATILVMYLVARAL